MHINICLYIRKHTHTRTHTHKHTHTHTHTQTHTYTYTHTHCHSHHCQRSARHHLAGAPPHPTLPPTSPFNPSLPLNTIFLNPSSPTVGKRVVVTRCRGCRSVVAVCVAVCVVVCVVVCVAGRVAVRCRVVVTLARALSPTRSSCATTPCVRGLPAIDHFKNTVPPPIFPPPLCPLPLCSPPFRSPARFPPVLCCPSQCASSERYKRVVCCRMCSRLALHPRKPPCPCPSIITTVILLVSPGFFSV